jgi:hypothetical protein
MIALDQHLASFDKLRMRSILCASKIAPHPEFVDGHRFFMQLLIEPE